MSAQQRAAALPVEWTLKRLKFIARVQTGMAKGKDVAGVETVEVPYLRVANVQDGYLDLDDVAIMTVPVDDLDRYRLRPGDVLMNEGGDFDKLGRGHVWHGRIDPCIHQNHVFAVRPHGVLPEWLNAYTGSAPAQFYFMGQAKQSTNLASISSSNLMELPVPVPPEPVQRRLLAHVERETARIDALIEKKTRLIELLREKRQALITRAVTRGLNPSVQMKDSGVQWLGDIPAHWQVTRLRFVIEAFDQGWSPDCYAFPAGPGEWGVLKAGCVNRGVFDPTENKRLPDEYQPREDIEVRVGDILMSRASGSSDLIGSVARATETDARLMLSDKTFRLRLRLDWDADFFVLTMHSNPLRDQIKLAISGAEGLANNLAQASIKDFVVVQPPAAEQRALVNAVRARLDQLDRLAITTGISVLLLRERRTALITAAVTGQIDIREAA
jgi:type I restriction enzyme S subunit